jgi:DNA-binding response OmpR family regulator
LRPQELRLLIVLARSPGVPVSRQELVRQAATNRRGASSRTVDMHMSRIRARIEPPSDYTYIHSVRGIGYRFEPVPKEAAVEQKAD